MKQLTFKGFLKRYLKSLSGTNTLSIRKLAQEVLPAKGRIAEPLYIYAMLNDQHGRLAKLAAVEYYRHEYEALNMKFSQSLSLLRALEDHEGDAPPRYQKVFNTYISIKNKPQTDRDFCKQTRIIIRKLQTDLHVSNYRIYKDLNLNPGNINDYLSNGALEHLSKDTAMAILRYLQVRQQDAA